MDEIKIFYVIHKFVGTLFSLFFFIVFRFLRAVYLVTYLMWRQMSVFIYTFHILICTIDFAWFSLSLFLFFSFLLCHEIIARDLKNSTFVWLDGLEFAIYFTGFKLIENHWPYLNGGYNPSKTHIKYNEKHVHRIPSNRLSVCNQSSVIVLVVSIR